MIKILIIGPSWIGDLVMSHCMYQLLFMKYSCAVQIDIMIPKWCQAIVSYMPQIHNVFFLPYVHGTLELKRCFLFGNVLKYKKYYQAIVLPNSFKSALIPFFSGITLRTGWRGEIRYGLLNDLRVLNPISFPLMVQRYAALVYDFNVVNHYSHLPYPLPFPKLCVQKKEIETVCTKFNLNNFSKLLIGLCFGSEFGPAKNWPHYYYIVLAMYLVDFGYNVVILGSSKNQFVCEFFEDNILKKNWKNFVLI